MRKVIIVLMFFSIPLIINAQGLSSLERIKLPQGLGISNQLEYSYDTKDKLEIFENWMNVDYRNGVFRTGLRFDIFQPNDPNPSISRGKGKFSEIDFYYLGIELGTAREKLKITAGNYYAMLGRGMILKSYEDRAIRVDNNLLGVKVEARYANFNLTALSGMPANTLNERKDILHAVDLEYRGLKFLKAGATYASNQPEDKNLSRTGLMSVRIEPRFWNFDFYAEYGVKQNNDVNKDTVLVDGEYVGESFYSSMNFYYGIFSLVGEYKYYDNFGFFTNDGTVAYNTPPAVIRDYTYMLLNRHPHALDPNNEQGFQFEANLNFSEKTSLILDYGETKSLKPSSYYKRITQSQLASGTMLREAYVQANHAFSDKWKTVIAFGYNEEKSSDSKNYTPILENRFYFDETNSVKLILEHQDTEINATNEKYFTDAVTLEYLRSPRLSIAVVAEMKTTEPTEGDKLRKVWSFIQFGYKFGDHTDVSLLFGSRQAGNICIGGVCRYEPEFRGVELKMQTRLY